MSILHVSGYLHVSDAVFHFDMSNNYCDDVTILLLINFQK